MSNSDRPAPRLRAASPAPSHPVNNADNIVRAYDAAAVDYDQRMAGDQWMRQALWDHYRGIFLPGQRVLDVGCGSGADAIFLAHHGIRVVGIDVAPEMIARLREKVAAAGVSDLIESRVCDYSDLCNWTDERFDGIVSAFAGLNGVPDLRHFAGAAARLLRPGGHLVVHLLNRWSLWEWLGLIRQRRWAEAGRLGQRTERTFVVGGIAICQYPFAPDLAYAAFFSPWFRLRRAYGLGILRPPHSVRRVPPRVARLLGVIDRRLGGLPALRGRGRLFVLDLVRRTETPVDAPGRSDG